MKQAEQRPHFFVREIPIYGRLILSPMAGYSDLPFRAVCHALGSAMCYTEFVAANAVVVRAPSQMRRLAYRAEEFPVVMQLFDNEVPGLLEAARICEALGADIVDINMGCSVANVAGRGAGAGLLRDPLKIAAIFRALSTQLTVPVTGKIRLGWDAETLNYLEVARAMEENGASLLAVHGRTKAQKYHGEANWEAIAEIKQALSIPVVGNGDITTVADCERRLAESRVDALMIGRAAIGNPWLFQGKDWWEVTPEAKASLIERHFELMLDFYGPERGLLNFRKHAVKYIRGTEGASSIRSRAVQATTVQAFVDLVSEFGESAMIAA
ncbi:MAG: tRNA dihydrouridine synthase DusB [Anaerolineales bacterium]|nr:tRNA dihydrouridine synthase DusB [Anaerolineales bacterium]MCB9172753.1 tRNA dihydrouridine synthase DusB [Ardenticatenales bacterium]